MQPPQVVYLNFMIELIIALLTMIVKPIKNKPRTLKERAIIWLDLAVFIIIIMGTLYFYTRYIKEPPRPIIIDIQK